MSNHGNIFSLNQPPLGAVFSPPDKQIIAQMQSVSVACCFKMLAWWLPGWQLTPHCCITQATRIAERKVDSGCDETLHVTQAPWPSVCLPHQTLLFVRGQQFLHQVNSISNI